MIDDSDLLRCYAETRSEDAFAQLVQRHIDRVYSLALRQLGGDRQLAEDAVQIVFSSLASKATSVAARPVLGGWLYRTTQYAATDLVRSERRRRARQETAHFMQQNSASEPSVDWEKVRPILNESLGELGDRDRDAVWLRFFEGRSFSEVGNQLRLTENAARMRVDRALAKLHAALARRGVTSTTAAIAAVLANQALVAAPAGLASTVTGTALATAAAATGGWLATTFMSLTKLQIGIAGAVLVSGTSGLAYLHHAHSTTLAETAALQAENQRLANQQKEVRPTAIFAPNGETPRANDLDTQRSKEAAETPERKALMAAVAPRTPQPLASPERFKVATETAPGKEDRAPTAKTQVVAVYPEALKTAGISGEVLVGFIVDSNGVVHNVVAKQSSQAEFEAPAVEAVSQWTFESGLKGGRPVNTRMEVPIAFAPGTEGTPTAPAHPAGS